MIFNLLINLLIVQTSVGSELWTKLIDKSNSFRLNLANDLIDGYETITKWTNISQECDQSLRATFTHLKSFDDWSIEMTNSWGRFPPSGILTGTTIDFGSYDQCLSVKPNPMIERPQYCLIGVRPPVPQPMPVHQNLYHRIDVLPKHFVTNKTNVFVKYSEFASFYYWIDIRTGICVPYKCSEKDIASLAKRFAQQYGLEYRGVMCQSNSDSNGSFTFGQILAM